MTRYQNWKCIFFVYCFSYICKLQYLNTKFRIPKNLLQFRTSFPDIKLTDISVTQMNITVEFQCSNYCFHMLLNFMYQVFPHFHIYMLFIYLYTIYLYVFMFPKKCLNFFLYVLKLFYKVQKFISSNVKEIKIFKTFLDSLFRIFFAVIYNFWNYLQLSQLIQMRQLSKHGFCKII